MGRKGKVDTRRKPILQLDENKKSGAKASKKNPHKGETTPKPKYQPLYVDGGAGEVFDPQEQEKVAAEIETFLKEIVAASKQEKGISGGQSVLDEFALSETMDTTVSSPFTASADAPVDTATVSFWQAVVDAKSNRSYYWNPATNEVSWTLPPNSVISNEQPVPALTGTGEAAAGAPVGGSLQDYYAYYSQQIYGVDASNPGQGATAVEEVKDNNTQVSVNHTAGSSPLTDAPTGTTAGAIVAPDSPVAPSEAFIGPAPAATSWNKGSMPANQDSPTVRGEKRLAEEIQSPSGAVGDSKKAKVQVEKSPSAKPKPTGTPSASSSASEQALRFQVSTMADEFMRKLQYLHIGDEGLSPLHVIKIQLQARLEDWKDGGLPSKHLLAKLREANKLVAEYEISAAPAGWKCVWDSATCRYFYQNISTEESSWEYPNHGPTSPAHSELSEQPLQMEQADASGRVVEPPVQADVSTAQEPCEVPMVTNTFPALAVTVLSEPQPQLLIELSTTSGMAHPPPPPPVESLLPPPPPPVLPGQAYSSVHTAAVTHPSSSIQPPDTTPVGQVSVSNWAPSVTVQPPAAAAACIPTSATASESQLNKNNKDTARTPKSSAKPANVEEKTLDEVRQKLQRPLRSGGGLYDLEDFAPYEEPERARVEIEAPTERARVQIEASTGMEFISEFPPTKPDAVVAPSPDERTEKKKKKGKKGKKQSEDDMEPAPLPVEQEAPAPKEPETAATTSAQKEPEAAAFMQELEPVFCVLRDSDIEVIQEQVTSTVPRKELVGNEYGAVAPELPRTAAVGFHHQGDYGSSDRQHWDQGIGDAISNMLPTPPQEVVVEDRAVYGMEDLQEGSMGADVGDMLQPSDELGYAGSVEVETVEMCIATSPSEPQDKAMRYEPQGGTAAPTSAFPGSQHGLEMQTFEVDGSARSLEESELIMRERLLRRVMQQQQQQQAATVGDGAEQEAGGDEGGSSGMVVTSELDDMGYGKAPDVAESVELAAEYGPDVRLLQQGGGSQSKFDDHSQVGLQLEVSTTVATREQSSAAAGKEPVRADVQVEEEGEIVSTPEKRQRPESPTKASTGKTSKRVVDKDDGKGKSSSSKRGKKHHSRSRSKSRERHGRRLRKHSDASDSDDYLRRSSRRGGRRHHDDRSDSEDYHHTTTRRSRRHSDSDAERSSSRKDKRHSRSVSRDSKDSRDKSQKRKKKDKKDKKKRRSHHSGSKERSGDDADKKKTSTPQNIIVGKVGSLGSIRQLGQEKKAQASTPQPEQSPSSFTSQQTMPMQQDQAAYYPQTSYMYGGYQYQYPVSGDQSWQSQQGWDQQGWQGPVTTTTTAATSTAAAAAGGEASSWSVTMATTTTPQQIWEQPKQHAEEQKQLEQVSSATEGWQQWSGNQTVEQQPQQQALFQEGESQGVVWPEGVKPGGQDALVEVVVVVPTAEARADAELAAPHLKVTGEDQEVVVEETIIDENPDIIEIPVDAEITECDMEIEQISSEAFLNEKRAAMLAAAAERDGELPPGAETPPATERDKTPLPIQQEPTAVLPVQPVATSSVTVPSEDQQQVPVKEKSAPAEAQSVVPVVTGGNSSSDAPSAVPVVTGGNSSSGHVESNGILVNGEEGRQTPPADDARRDRSTPGTPTTAEAPPPATTTSTTSAASTPQAYNYGTYAAQAAAMPPGYDYAAYSQAGYDYSQAYSAYVQAAAASMAYASYSQYYANPYAAAFAGFGSPYAAYYSYANAGAFQSPGQQAAAASQNQQTDSGKKSKKEESKGMIEKWNTLQTQYGKPS